MSQSITTPGSDDQKVHTPAVTEVASPRETLSTTLESLTGVNTVSHEETMLEDDVQFTLELEPEFHSKFMGTYSFVHDVEQLESAIKRSLTAHADLFDDVNPRIQTPAQLGDGMYESNELTVTLSL